MFNSGFPTNTFTWQDNSGASTGVLFSPPEDGLNVPFGFILAERGTPGAIVFGGAKELTAAFGTTTFDSQSPYFNSSTQFLGEAMGGQGVEAMRLVDPAATVAQFGIFLSVTPGPVVQYTKDNSGARVVDENGDFIPKKKVDGVTILTEPGLIVKWVSRALTGSEIAGQLTTHTVVNSDTTTSTIYPVTDYEMASQGSYGNRQGLSLYSTGSSNASIAQSLNSVLYRFAPKSLPTAVSTTAGPINDIFGAGFNDVSFKDVAVYNKTNTNYALKYVLGNTYVDNQSGVALLPYNVTVYGANIGLVGTAALALSTELGAIDPYLLDLISGQDLNGNYYDHIEIDPASAMVVSSSVVNYAEGGTDGDTSFTKLQSLIQDWLEGGDHGEFTNVQQHPMTHFSDPGFSMDTKLALLNMLTMRDFFKIDLSTQDISLPANTKAQDMSAGQTLSFRSQMYPESIINGVGCSRVGVYAHAAPLVTGSPFGGIVPFTLNRLIQRRNLDGGTYIKGSSGGLPNSQVTIFRAPNWVADDDSIRALAWASSMNVVQHATRTKLFYASLRTVYPNDTSLLSDDEISDRIIYMSKICREIWAIYAGVRRPSKKVFPLIERDLTNRFTFAFQGDDINIVPTVFQTAQDANLGYATSVNLDLTGDSPMRQMNFNVIVGRSGE